MTVGPATRADTGRSLAVAAREAPPRFDHCLCTTYRYGRVVFPRMDALLYDALMLCGDYCIGEQHVQGRLVPAGGVALDIGANIGLMTLQLADLVGATGRVLAFEPCPYTYGLLVANLRINGITWVEPRRTVVSSADGTIDFLDPDLVQVVRMDFGRFAVDDPAGKRPGRMVPTPKVTVDGFALERCDYIKIDVEGHEAEVVRGAMETIRRHRPALSIEAWDPDGDLSWIELLRPLGYRICVLAARVLPAPNFKNYDVSALSKVITVQAFCLPEGTDVHRVFEEVPYVETPDRDAMIARLSRFSRG